MPRWLWLLLALEAILFWHYASTQIAPFYPAGHDQTSYLVATYRFLAMLQTGNFLALMADIVGPGYPTGVAYQLQGALLALFLGAGRTSLLVLNFLYFAVLQVVLFRTVQWKTASSRLALIAVALLLTQSSMMHLFGGMFDYRIDFVAYCTFGLWTCFVLRSGFFKGRGWSVAAGLTAALLIAMRFLSAIYVGLIMSLLLACIIMQLVRLKSRLQKAMYRLRLYNFFVSAAPCCLLVPLFWLKRHALYNYYIVGHVTGPEKDIRALEAGITSMADALVYYPRSILFEHLGASFLLALSILLLATGLLHLIAWQRGSARLRPSIGGLSFVLAACVIPVGLLTLDTSKSSVMGSIVGVPFVLLCILVSSAAPGAWRSPVRFDTSLLAYAQNILQKLVAISIMLIAFATFTLRLNAPAPFGYEKDDLQRVNEVQDWVISFVIRNGLVKPALSLDYLTDALSVGPMQVAAYERRGKLIDFQGKLSHGPLFLQLDRDTALRQLEDSDIIILTDRPKEGIAPLVQSIRSYWSDLWEWANAHRFLSKVFTFNHFNVYVFLRPLATVSGTVGEGAWISSEGIMIKSDAIALRRAPIFLLVGHTNFDWLPRLPKPTAELLDDDQKVLTLLPSMLKRDGSQYEIIIDGRAALRSNQDPVQVRLSFDTFFVPKQLGLSDDPRELVIMAPTSVEMQSAKD